MRIRRLPALLVVLLAMVPACVSGVADETTTTADDDGMGHEHEDGHEHGKVKEWDGGGVPSIDLEVTEVAEGGWQVAVDVTNFVFEGFDSQQHLPGHGHVHVLVDGVEWGMVYEPVFTIDHFDPGPHTISVTLSSNDHMDYAINGQRITAMATVEVAGEVEKADFTIRLEIHEGHVVVEPTEPQAAFGDIVELIVTSHIQETVHIHGYDLLLPVGPEAPATLRFTVDVVGIFEVELEHSGAHLFEITVQ